MTAHAASTLPQELAAPCLEHLGQEERCLGLLGQGLEAMRVALTAGRWDDLADVLRQVEPHLQTRDRLQVQRRALVNEVARCLHLDAATMSLARVAVPASLAEGWSATLSRLRLLARRLDRLTRHVAFLAQHHWDFLQSFLSGLALGSSQAHCYGPDGQLTASAHGALVQARG
jgi:hypothetical protein